MRRHSARPERLHRADGKADPHYRDQQQLYTSFDCKPRAVTAAEIEASTVTRRELKF